MEGCFFREMTKFNEALLAKQVWRLHTNGFHILYKVFSPKCFPHGSLLDPLLKVLTLGTTFCMQRNSLKKGSTWRIGDYNTIHIGGGGGRGGGNWIPNPGNQKVVSICLGFHHNATINTLFIPRMTTSLTIYFFLSRLS